MLITGSSIVNKTLPRLLELCKNAYVVLTGPTVPLCPALLERGIDRLAGMVVTDRAGARRHAAECLEGAARGGMPRGPALSLRAHLPAGEGYLR